MSDDDVSPAKQRLTREGGDKGLSLSERLSGALSLVGYKTPLHKMRLKGRFPLKLTAVPQDPIPGDAGIGTAIVQGQLRHQGANVAARDFGSALGNGGIAGGFGQIQIRGHRQRHLPACRRNFREHELIKDLRRQLGGRRLGKEPGRGSVLVARRCQRTAGKPEQQSAQ